MKQWLNYTVIYFASFLAKKQYVLIYTELMTRCSSVMSSTHTLLHAILSHTNIILKFLLLCYQRISVRLIAFDVHLHA